MIYRLKESTYLLFKKDFHISWQIGVLAGGIIMGIAVIPLIGHQQFLKTHLFFLGMLLVFIGMLRRSMFACVLICIGGVILGAHIGAQKIHSFMPVTAFIGSEVTISGTVRDDTTKGPSGDTRLRINSVSINDTPVAGNIWISTRNESTIMRSDKVTVVGRLSEGFGVVQGSVFRAELIELIRPQPGDVTRTARDAFSQNVQAHIPSPESNIGVSFLVGQRTSLPTEVQETFRSLGLIHLVVASGFHLSIVIGFSKKVFSRYSAYLTVFGGLSLIWFFLLLTGFSTSMMRASIVTGISLLAWYVGRTVHPVSLLLYVAAATAVINPLFVWGDIGWYLSFSAFAGVIILAPLLQVYLWGEDSEPGFFRYLIIATLSAQITTFPVIAYTFSQYSNLALIANALVLPIVPPIMMGVFLVGMVGFIASPIAQVLAFPVYWALKYVNLIGDTLLRWGNSTSEIDLSLTGVAVSYILIIVIIVYLRVATGHSLRRVNAIDIIK